MKIGHQFVILIDILLAHSQLCRTKPHLKTELNSANICDLQYHP